MNGVGRTYTVAIEMDSVQKVVDLVIPDDADWTAELTTHPNGDDCTYEVRITARWDGEQNRRKLDSFKIRRA